MDSPFWWRETTGDVHVAFTSAAFGNVGLHVGEPQDALRNRRRLDERLGIRARFLQQTHSDRVVDAQAQTGEPDADAWISTERSALAVMVADCLPVLFASPGSRGGPITAAAHAGRSGLLSGILENTVAEMNHRGAEAITAWIGPGACGRCYEVPQAMVQAAAADRPAIASHTSWGTWALDLRAEAHAVLDAAGVEVVDVPGCTIEDPQLFSHRRAQVAAEPQGRFAGVVWC